MNVRKFVAPTIVEALSDIKRELGEDAVILRTKTVRKSGMFAFLAKDAVEVMAASPDRNPPESPAVVDQVAQIRRKLESRPSDSAVGELKDELSELKGHLREIAEQVKYERMPALPTHLANKYRTLVNAGISSQTATELTEQLNLAHNGEELENDELVTRELVEKIAQKIKVRLPAPKKNDKARIIALIGPTGVGKTTTLAKLATSYRFWGGSDTAIVSADTYRVAALEQIKTFAAIAGLPMEAVYQPGAMPTALGRHLHRDALFVDTPGRSQSDGQKLEELAAFLDAAQTDERLLCLSVNTRIEDQFDIIERYSRLNPTGIIFTKLDDSRHPGGILTVAERSNIPLTYITCGQNVPEDLVAIDRVKLAKHFLSPNVYGRQLQERFESWITADEIRARGGNDGR